MSVILHLLLQNTALKHKFEMITIYYTLVGDYNFTDVGIDSNFKTAVIDYNFTVVAIDHTGCR